MPEPKTSFCSEIGKKPVFKRSSFVQHSYLWTSVASSALVDVSTSSRGLDVALGALALAPGAGLAILAVQVGVTPGPAELVDTDLTLEAVLVGVTHFQAHSVDALLSSGAVGADGASPHAKVLVAPVAWGVRGTYNYCVSF